MREWTPTLGAVVREGRTSMRVWAPDRARVDLVVERAPRPEVRPLTRDSHGHWCGTFDDLPAGTRYRYRLDGDGGRCVPDPVSRFQPEGVHGASEVVDPSSFAWRHAPPHVRPLGRHVIYELHVGTFDVPRDADGRPLRGGTFADVIARLGDLRDLGVTAIELMPVAAFAGERNWGYDGVALFAPSHTYGHPDDLRALVDAAHADGLAVILDVVYNHFGPDGAYATAFTDAYFTDRHRTPWGDAINLDGPGSDGVRRFILENALHWLHEYHVDGLRLDATHALHDDSAVHLLQELACAVRLTGRERLLIAEDERNLARLLRPVEDGGFGLDGVWSDDLHHQLHVQLTGERQGYYRDYTGAVDDIAATMRRGWFFTGQPSVHAGGARGTDPTGLTAEQFIVCLQNHDQVGNRATGDRLHAGVDAAIWRAATALLLLGPQTPLLFMGQEWAASSPFLYFTAHDAALGEAVTRGRRDEFGTFASFTGAAADLIPDPQALTTFHASCLRWDERDQPDHARVLALTRALLALRTATPAAAGDRATAQAIDDELLAFTRGPLLVLVRLSGHGSVVLPDGDGPPLEIALSTEDPAFVPDPCPVVNSDEHPVQVVFHRPGAVVLRSRP